MTIKNIEINPSEVCTIKTYPIFADRNAPRSLKVTTLKDDFVIPCENADEAETLRKQILSAIRG